MADTKTNFTVQLTGTDGNIFNIRFTVKEYLEYWNHYRPHAGLDGRMVLPYQQDADGEIQEISFLGGLLHSYRRVKQVA